MNRYRVAKDYQGVIAGTHFYLEAGAELTIPDGDATQINAEQAGTLDRIGGEPERRPPDAPNHDRMIRKSKKRTEG